MRFSVVDRSRSEPPGHQASARPLEPPVTRFLQNLLGRTPALTLGLIAAALALTVEHTQPKYVIAGAATLVFAVALLAQPSSKRTSHVLLALFALSIPFNVQKTWLYRPHVGGAVGITVALSDVVAGALALVWLYRNVGSGSRYLTRVQGPLVVAWLAFIGTGILSFWHAAHRELVFFELIRLCKLLFLMVIVMNLEEEDVWIFLRWIAVGVALESGLAALQYTTKQNLGLGQFGEEKLVAQPLGVTIFRASGTLGHPNMLGYYYEMLVPLMLAFSLAASKWKARILYGSIAALGLAGIIMTLSRGAWVGLPVSMTMVMLGMRRGLRPNWNTLRTYAFAAVLCAGLLAIFMPTIIKRLTHADYTSAQSRIPLNRATFSLVEQYPFFGVGLNNFQEVFKGYDRTGYSRRFAGYSHVVHNLYLLVWAEVGTVGFMAFLAFLAVALRTAARAAARAPLRRRAVLIGIGSGLVAHLIHGLFDPGFKVSFGISTLVFALLGLVGCIDLLERDDRLREQIGR